MKLIPLIVRHKCSIVLLQHQKFGLLNHPLVQYEANNTLDPTRLPQSQPFVSLSPPAITPRCISDCTKPDSYSSDRSRPMTKPGRRRIATASETEAPNVGRAEKKNEERQNEGNEATDEGATGTPVDFFLSPFLHLRFRLSSVCPARPRSYCTTNIRYMCISI